VTVSTGSDKPEDKKTDAQKAEEKKKEEERQKKAEERKQKAAEERKKRDERKQRGEKDPDQEIDRKMDKTSQVTLWVDPTTHQIVKYTFENVWLDFLPAGWLVRIDDLRANMQMGQPFPDVWLPKNMNIHPA